MQFTTLGRTSLRVSRICLGSMTWGEQNSEPEAHAQLDAALDAGVNFIDTAEMYAIPPRAGTQGLTEQYIGNWLSKSGKRNRVVLATKVAGPAQWMAHLRGGPRLDRANIEQALHDSLRRLQTDHIDLYQLHWPERATNYFGRLGYKHEPAEVAVPIEDTLDVLAGLVSAGKVLHVGVSNETPWGVMRYLQIAEARGRPRIVSIQNPYNLLNRSYEIGLAEISHREDIGLLAYSPLAFGTLSGKYLRGAHPAGGRLTLFERYKRYTNPQGVAATEAYVQLAREHGLDPAQMALAYVLSRPFVTSAIIGATTMEQLHSNLASVDLDLPPQVIEGIEEIHVRQPNPCP
jgi:aryl-alcohol dehydrogenase-like predicted oxidoreductase